MIVRAHTVVTMDGPPIEDGAVLVSGDSIVEVGEFSEIKSIHAPEPQEDEKGEKVETAQPVQEIVDLGDQVLLPGLINGHCHLDYTCLRGKIPPPESFTDWIRAINNAKEKLRPRDYLKSIESGFAEARDFGTTTVINFEAFPDLIIRTAPPIRTWWLAELMDVRSNIRPREIVDLAMTAMVGVKNRGLAPHSLFTASRNLYRRCQEVARSHDLVLSTHLAESNEERAMFQDVSGPLFDFMKEIGRDARDCGGDTPLAHLVRQIGLDERWLVAHLNELSETDFELLEDSEAKFHVVHCPRSHKYFGHAPFAFERLSGLGFKVCLGTDSLASNQDLSLFAEMRQMHDTNPGLAPRKILEMITTNPARALDRQSTLGQIKSGAHADMIALPLSAGGDVHEQILAFDQIVPWKMIAGQCAQ